MLKKTWISFLILMTAQTPGISGKLDIKDSFLGTSRVMDDYLRHISSRHFEEARQIVVWSLGNLQAESFLESLLCPRLVTNSTDHMDNLFNCNFEVESLFVFLEDHLTDMLASLTSTLAECWLRPHFILVFTEVNNSTIIDHRRLEEIFRWLAQAEVVDVVALVPEESAVKVFTYEPYKEDCVPGDSPVLVDIWSKNTSSPKMPFRPMVTSLHGCTLRLTTLDLAPDVIFKEITDKEVHHHRSGSPKVIPKLDGIEVRLMKTLADKMNFTPRFMLPSDGSHWGWVQFNGTVTGMIADIKNKISDVGFGHVTEGMQDVGFLEYSTSLGVDCYGWGVPLGAGRQTPAWVMLTTEFTLLTWSLLFVALLISAFAIWSLPKALPRRLEPDREVYRTPRSVLCYTCNTLIAAPILTQPRSQPVRTFVSLWLLYCIVVSVAYQAQLGSNVTVPWRPTDIRDIKELLESGLTLKTPWKFVAILNKSRDDEENPLFKEMVSRFQPVSKMKEAVDQLQNQNRNFAYLMYRRSLEFYASQSGWKFHVMSEACLLKHHTTLALRRGSPLIPRFNVIIQRLIESGFVDKWVSDFTPRSPGTDILKSGLSLPHLSSAFMVLLMGLLLALLMFLLEIFRSKFWVQKEKYPTSHKTKILL
ncbi:glutamate receptor ionotropic, delta-1-like [Periplaneta americana]|uniref:glutamate receptor ionotropic, delta-1-like n=1 Tax=Periplaneta americana TaxID=6978 RepID=UPI0037E8E31A